MSLENNSLDIAVWMVTYNHEKYISESIESIINQTGTINFKLYIGEDCSTDKTREICLKYKEKYPDKIELFLHEKNMGPVQNGNFMYKVCHESGAKYIAMCEGDDYWIYTNKLQRHFDFLEENKDYVLVADNSYWDDVATGKRFLFNQNPDGDVNINSIVEKRRFGTASVLYRNVEEICAGPNVILGDTFLFCLLSRLGKFKFFSRVSSVYRRHPGGITNTQKLSWAKEMELWNKRLYSLFPELDKNILNEKNLIEFRAAAIYYLQNKNLKNYLICCFKCIVYKPKQGLSFFFTNLKDWILSKLKGKK